MNQLSMINSTTQKPDFLAIQKSLCKQYKFDFSQVEQLNAQLTSLLSNIFKETTLDVLESQMDEAVKALNYWESIQKILAKEMKDKPQEKSLLNLFSYLLLAEGIYTKIVDLLTYFLVESHHEILLHNDFVNNLDQIEKIDLLLKMRFLEKHGFSLITSSLDRNLRNDIAHLNITVETNGRIVDKDKRGVTNIIDRMDRAGCICALVITSISNVLDEELSKLKAKYGKA